MKVRRRASKPPRNCNAEQEQRDCGEVVFHAVSVIENPFLTGRGFRGGNAGIRPQIERMFMRSIGVLPAAEGLLAQASAAVASARPRPTTQTTNAGDLCSAIPCHRIPCSEFTLVNAFTQSKLQRPRLALGYSPYWDRTLETDIFRAASREASGERPRPMASLCELNTRVW